MTVAVFGKLRTQPDFFRHGQLSPSVSEAERWLQEAYEALRGAGLDLPRDPVYFVLSGPRWPEVVVAVAVSSADSVGRSFPLAAFTAVDAGAVAGRGWAVPLLYARYLEELQGALARAAADGDGARLLGELGRLPQINPSLFQHADAMAQNLVAAHTVRAFEARLFDHPDERFYAYRTLRMACDQARGASQDQAAVVLGCPFGLDVDIVAWAAMASRILGWPFALPMIWSKAPEPRLMLSLGTTPAGALRFLIEERSDSMRFWPLATRSEPAIAAARDALRHTASWDIDGEPLPSLFERVATFS